MKVARTASNMTRNEITEIYRTCKLIKFSTKISNEYFREPKQRNYTFNTVYSVQSK